MPNFIIRQRILPNKEAKIDQVLPKKDPATLVINKWLEDITGDIKRYNKKYGEVTYTIRSADGSSFNIYSKNGSTYTAIGDAAASHTLLEDPATAANTKKYYLEAGREYIVEEHYTNEAAQSIKMGIASPSYVYDSHVSNAGSFTPNENQDWTAKFINTERKGQVTVYKVATGSKPVALDGADFTIVRKDGGALNDAGDTSKSGTTDVTHGAVEFKDLYWGEYIITETKAPVGYKLPDVVSQTVVVDTNNEKKVTFKDQKTDVWVKLTKYLGTNEANIKDNSHLAGDYGNFVIERKIDGGEWTTVTEDYSKAAIPSKTSNETGTKGTIRVLLPAYDTEGHLYTYRFKESLGSDYYAPNAWHFDESGNVVYDTTVYSEEKDLLKDGEVSIDDIEFVMENRKKVSIKVNKKFLDVNGTTSLSENTTKNTDITLWRASGSTYIRVPDTKTAGGSTQAVWANLPLYDENGPIAYYVSEKSVDGYLLDEIVKNDSGIQLKGTGNLVPVSINTLTSGAVVKTLNNVQQAVPVKIYKKNYYTKAFVEGAGATVYNEDQTAIARNVPTKGDNELKDQAITSSEGLVVYLTPGQKYKVVETVNGTGLTQVNATSADPLTVDLSGITGIKYGENVPVQSVIIYNKPNPNIQISKTGRKYSTTGGNDTTESLNEKNVTFKLYTKDPGESDPATFTPVLDTEGNSVVIPANGSLSGIRLTASEYIKYYVVEQGTPDGYLDPSVVPEEYILSYNKTEQNYISGKDSETGNRLTFIKLNVTDRTGRSDSTKFDNECYFTIENIKNEADIQIQKYIDGSFANTSAGSGFVVRVKSTASTIDKDEPATTANGIATVVNLPVYDASGNKIRYRVTEDPIPADKENDYYEVDENAYQETVLSIGETTTTVNGTTTPLIVWNESYTKYKATKLFFHTWEFPYTHVAYLMNGVELGLYKLVGDKYVYQESLNTTGYAEAEFQKLRRDEAYVIVEIKSGDPYMYPWSGTEYKKYAVGTDGNALSEIAVSNIDQYNYLSIPKQTSTVSRPKEDEGTIRNADKWVQFDITKWLDADTYSTKEQLAALEKSAVDEENDSKYDDAVFSLYRYEVTEGFAVSFDPANPEASGWELQGQYISGTAYDADGKRQKGEFLTDVDQCAKENVIYLLVEEDAGPGDGEIYAGYKYTLYQCNEAPSEYTVTVGSPSAYVRSGPDYTLNTIRDDDILNGKPVGPGNEGIMLAGIRIAKWYDEFDTKAGNWKSKDQGELYQPLPNAKFGLYLSEDCTESSLLEELTVGLDNKTDDKTKWKAWAQGATYRFAINTASTATPQTKYYLVNYLEPDYYSYFGEDSVKIIEDAQINGSTVKVYAVKVYLKETKAPQDFSFDSTLVHPMYLCFIEAKPNTQTKIFNDAFFVTGRTPSTDPSDPEEILGELQFDDFGLYFTSADTDASGKPNFDYGDNQYRLVDYPIHNKMVRVRKYGYEPTTDTLNKTSEALDALVKNGTDISRENLGGVKMRLWHKNASGTWELYNYPIGVNDFKETIYNTSAEFTINSQGYFVFPDGLPDGEYRIDEISIGSNSAYEIAYPANKRYRYFTVGTSDNAKEVSMYNPKKARLTITKEGMNGENLTGAGFGLYAINTTTRKYDFTYNSENKTYTASNIDSGTYWLQETSVPTGYTKAYLAKYIEATYSAYKNLTKKANGVQFGYTYKQQSVDANGNADVIIDSIGFNDADIKLVVKDPELGKFTIKKYNEEDPDELTSAEFTVYYKAFPNWEYDKDHPYDVSSVNLKATKWSGATNGKVTVNGSLTLTGLQPGIYAIQEENPAEGFTEIQTKKNSESDPEDIIYYVIVKGGMDVTVTGLPETADIYEADGSKKKEGAAGSVQTLYTVEDKNETAEVAIPNRPKTTAQASKSVIQGDITDDLSWSIRLDLYNPNKTDVIGAAILNQDTTGYITFTTLGADGNPTTTPVKLVQGYTYYVKEAVTSTPARDYEVASVSVYGITATGNAGYYPVTVKDAGIISIDVVNRYMRGKVEFEKKDRETGALLHGAEFKVCKDAAGTQVISGASVKEEKDTAGKGTGKYIVDIPLTSVASTSYYVIETKAPEHYLLDREHPASFEVELSAEHNYVDLVAENEPVVNNYGWYVDLTKYANWYVAGTTVPTAAQDDAAFTVYQYVPETGWKLVPSYDPVDSSKTSVDANGEIRWLLDPNFKYAIEESYFNAGKYIAIDSVYQITKDESGNIISRTPMELKTDVISGKKVFVIENLTADIEFEVYNNPKIKARIIKRDVGGSKETFGIVPRASYSIYEITDAEKASLTGDKVTDNALVSAMISGKTAVRSAITNTKNKTNNPDYYYDDWTDRDPYKNYIVVEMEVLSGDNSVHEYDTLNKDDNRVIWYRVIDKVTGTPDPAAVPEFELDNVLSEAYVIVKKTKTSGTVGSLLKSDQTVTFSIDADVTAINPEGKTNPQVKKANQPLASFVLNDVGMTFTGIKADGTELPNVDEDYAITSLTLGGASHDVTHFVLPSGVSIDDTSIDAIVTWKDKNGTTIQTISVKGVSGEAQTILAPDGTRAFSISYSCSDVKTKTENKYALGMDFDPGTITVSANLKQTVSTEENPVITEISKFDNTVKASLTYPKWRSDGSGYEEEIVERDDNAEAVVPVESNKLPVVSITKTSTNDINGVVYVGGTYTYRLTVTNESDTEDFHDPVVIDMLPTGVAFSELVSSTVTGSKGEVFNIEVERYSESGTGTTDPETAVLFRLPGTLKHGSYVNIDFKVVISDSVLLYERDTNNNINIHNYTYLSSDYHTYRTNENPNGISFVTQEADTSKKYYWAGDLEAAAGSEGTIAAQRAAKLEKILGDDYTDGTQYLWQHANKSLIATVNGSMVLSKAVHGDLDSGFSSEVDFVGTASRNNSTPGIAYDNGSVDYRLTLMNTSDTNRTGLVIGDEVPWYQNNGGTVTKDHLGSDWGVVMTGITGITLYKKGAEPKNLAVGTDYKIFYYTGSAPYNDLISTLRDNTANKPSAWFNDATKVPSSWKGADPTTSKAFIIVFNPSIVLTAKESIVVEYHTKTEDIRDDHDFYERAAFQISKNRFYGVYSGIVSGQNLESNEVHVTLMDGNVSVQGDVWVDEEWIGKQKHYRSTEEYLKYDIIKKLSNSIYFSITDERKASGQKSTDDKFGTNTSIGESIRHFTFEDLYPAGETRDHDVNKPWDMYTGELLNTKMLSTDDPYHYSLNAEVTDASLLDIIELTTTGDGHFVSDDPDKVKGTTTYTTPYNERENALDNNFTQTAAGKYEAAPFYLRYSGVPDESKDIGFKFKRNLEITKQAADNADVKIKDAKFNIYGPYAEDYAVTADNYNAKTYATGVLTDEYGQLLIKDLNWWMKYVIEEVDNNTGYEIKDAVAVPDNTDPETGTSELTAVTGKDGVWVLNLPTYRKLKKTDKVIVKDVRETTVTFEAYKNLEVENSDYELTAGEYTFELRDSEGTLVGGGYKLNGNATSEDPYDVTKAVFDSIVIDREGTFEYTIKEVIPSPQLPHITYSEKVATASVVVEWVGADAEISKPHLKTTVTYTGADSEGTHTGNVFTNKYKPLTTSVAIPVKKVVTGNPRPTNNRATFSFALKRITEGAPMPEGTTGDTAVITIKDGGTKDFTNTAFFEDIVFATGSVVEADYPVYEYELSEIDGGVYGYDYDGSVKKLRITVKDDGGTLKAKVTDITGTETILKDFDESTVPEEKFSTFTNNYKPDTVTVSVAVKKKITGNERVEDLKKDFVFTLKGSDDVNESITIHDAGEESFPELVYAFEGTYEYTVKEVEPSTKPVGYTYDGTEYTVRFEVTDEGGVLYAETFVDNVSKGKAKSGSVPVAELEFENHYEPVKATFSIPFKKVVPGNERPAGWPENFTFTLTAISPDAPTPVTDTLQIQDDGTIGFVGTAVFEGFEYTKAHVATPYVYELKEVPEGRHGYVYDTTVHTLSVYVKDNDGTLETWITDNGVTIKDYENRDGSTVKETVFTNEYHPDKATASVAVKKLITGNDRVEEYQKTFEFTLKATTSTPDLATDSIAIKDTGYNKFVVEADKGTLEFSKAGTYEYIVKEVIPDPIPKGYTYDKTVHDVKFVVTDVKGILKVETIVDGESKGEGAVALSTFTNDYTPATTSVAFKAEKYITGDDRVNKKTFTFNFTATDSTYPLPEYDSVEIVDEGTADFGKIVYDKAGTYTYTVSEQNDGLHGYTYSDKVYEVVVTVVDKDGYLEATYTVDGEPYTEDEVFNFEFTNNYKTEPDKVYLDVTKKFTGEARPDSLKTDFTFVLKAASPSDAPMPAKDTITVYDADKAEFEAITFTKVGTYEYELSEVDDGEEGYTYDKSVKHVVITVTDEDHILTAVCKIDDETTASTTFTNKFVGASDLVIKKTVQGVKSKTDFGFEVKLLHKDGTPYGGTLPAVKEKADGSIENVTLSFNAEGVAQFTLNDKEVLTISDLVIGTKYFVTETETLKYEMTCENTNGVIAKTNEPATFLNKKNDNHIEPSGGGGGGGGKPTTTPASIPDPPASPTGEPRHPSASYTPQDPLTQNILGASEDFRNNLVLAANNFRNNLVLGANGSRVFTGDTSNILLYLILLLTSGLGLTGAAVLVKRRKKEDEE